MHVHGHLFCEVLHFTYLVSTSIILRMSESLSLHCFAIIFMCVRSTSPRRACLALYCISLSQSQYLAYCFYKINARAICLSNFQLLKAFQNPSKILLCWVHLPLREIARRTKCGCVWGEVERL